MFLIFSQLAPKEAGDFGVELQKLGGFGAKAALRQDRVRAAHWGIRCVRLHVTRNAKGVMTGRVVWKGLNKNSNTNTVRLLNGSEIWNIYTSLFLVCQLTPI